METSQLHVVHAWAPVARWLKLAGSRLTASELAKIDRANEKEHSNRLDELLAKFPLDDMKVQRVCWKAMPAISFLGWL